MEELLKRLFPNRLLAAELILTSIFINILAFAVPLFVIQVLNRFVAHGITSTLVTLIIGGLLAVVMELTLKQLRLRLASVICAYSDQALSKRIFDCMINIRTHAIEKIPVGWRQQAMLNIEKIHHAYSASNITALLDVPFAIFFLIALWILSPPIAIFASLCIALALISGFIDIRLNKSASNKMLNANALKQSLVLTSTMNGVETIRAFNAKPVVGAAWGKIMDTLKDLKHTLQRSQGFIGNFTQSANSTLTVGVISIGALQVVSGDLTVGALIGCNIIAGRALMPITRLVKLKEGMDEADAALVNLKRLESLPMIPEKGTVLKQYNGRITFQDLGFSYENSPTPVFESLKLDLFSGSVVVVVGQNGAGKTTFAKLLMGLIDPVRGQILIDGIDLRQIEPAWWRKQVCYMPQEPSFIDATILENIIINNPEIASDRLADIIEKAGLRSYLDSTAEGLSQKIKENAHELSLGIRHRLALARALATDGRLLVFDEPTDGLDKEGQQCVYQILNERLANGCTIIVFTHDEKILQAADCIIDLTEKPVPRITLPDKNNTQTSKVGS